MNYDMLSLNQKYRIMSITLEHRETDRKGSFIARGTSFYYQYCASKNRLNICHAETKSVLRSVTLEKRTLCNPLQFVHSFDKSSKIKALIFSNHKTVRLCNTLEGEKLLALLPNIERLTRYTCKLKNEQFRDFCKGFAQDFALQSIYIHKTEGNNGLDFYNAGVTSIHNHSVEARATSLHGILRETATKVMHDLVMMEYGYSHHGSAHNLLTVSSKLSTLSRIVNNDYIPEFHLAEESSGESLIEA